jgi:hypothetical protein
MTPFEAAMTARHAAVVDAGNFPTLWCLAASQHNADAQCWLRARVHTLPPADCGAVDVGEIRP